MLSIKVFEHVLSVSNSTKQAASMLYEFQLRRVRIEEQKSRIRQLRADVSRLSRAGCEHKSSGWSASECLKNLVRDEPPLTPPPMSGNCAGVWTSRPTKEISGAILFQSHRLGLVARLVAFFWLLGIASGRSVGGGMNDNAAFRKLPS